MALLQYKAPVNYEAHQGMEFSITETFCDTDPMTRGFRRLPFHLQNFSDCEHYPCFGRHEH